MNYCCNNSTKLPFQLCLLYGFFPFQLHWITILMVEDAIIILYNSERTQRHWMALDTYSKIDSITENQYSYSVIQYNVHFSQINFWQSLRYFLLILLIFFYFLLSWLFIIYSKFIYISTVIRSQFNRIS